jgi:hypothetical protein
VTRGFAAAIVLFCLATGAQAQAADLAGGWAFETSPHRESGCVIRGEALMRERPQPGAFDVQMRAAEHCPDGNIYRAEERCVARRQARAVHVTCTLVRADPDSYLADQFSLTIESADLMHGRLVDYGYWDEPVRWRRASAPIANFPTRKFA